MILGQSGPRSNVIEWVLRIPQSSSITEASLSDCLVSYPGHLLMVVVGVLPLCREAIGVFYRPSWLGILKLIFQLYFNCYFYKSSFQL